MDDVSHQVSARETGEQAIIAKLSGVTRDYPAARGAKPLHALGPIDLELKQGEFFSVVGPSGCGKSTLLDILTGLSPPTAGTATFEGKRIHGVPDGVGVVFQEDATFPWLDVEANLSFGLKQLQLSARERQDRVEQALRIMGLVGFRSAFPAQLSGGMRQRVCIARTLVTQPRLIVLDEPFGSLDQQTRLLMGDELLRIWRETGATVFFITHSIDEAVMLSDRVGVMSARPGTFIDMLETGWAQKRDSRNVADPHFGKLTGQIWGKLRGEALRQMQLQNDVAL